MSAKKVKPRKVSLDSIKTLTLRKGQITTGRREDGVPQLQCMGKLCAYAPQVVQCRQTGHDGVSPQWACEADLPEGMRFGNLEVVCEGWSRPGDTNVLAGSCALEYELQGRPEAAFGSWAHVKKREENDYSGWAIKALWIAVALFFIYKIFRVRVRWDPNGNRPRGGGPGGGGGGGGWGGGGPGGGWGPGGGDSSPPPPYSAQPKPDPATNTAPAQGLGSRSYTSATQGGSSGPGFWTGMAAGAAGAAALNWATRGRDQERERREEAGDYARWRAQRLAQRSWADYEPSTRDTGPSDAGPSRRATGYGGSRTR